jgi:hypothetical protein
MPLKSLLPSLRVMCVQVFVLAADFRHFVQWQWGAVAVLVPALRCGDSVQGTLSV